MKKLDADKEVKEALYRQSVMQSVQRMFSRGNQALVKQWQTYIERGGCYV